MCGSWKALICMLQAVLVDAAIQVNPNYAVQFDGISKMVLEHKCQGASCYGPESNNLASYTMADGQNGGYVPVFVQVTSLHWTEALGRDWNIRPAHLVDEGTVGQIDTSQLDRGTLSFTVHRPCQISVEVGTESKLLPDREAFHKFANLILSINPPETHWPQKKPKAVTMSSCKSAEPGRSCVLGEATGSCADLFVKEDEDLYFFAGRSTSYTWGHGCGSAPKRMLIRGGGRVFIDDDVIVYARIISDGDVSAGLYGYGFVSNQHMRGVKNKGIANVINLSGPRSEVFGVTALDSTYRNIQVGKSSVVSWTKSFAWNSETDCVNLKASGARVRNNFFKTNDDCLKGYQPDTFFANNVIWRKTVGRAIMLSWSNLGEAHDLDSTVHYLNTSIIHDELAFESALPDNSVPEALALQASMIYYSTLINAQHSPHNVIGTPSSPVIIENLYLEGRISSVLLLTNGYAHLNNKAPWMGTDGCTGNINMKVSNLDMSRVTQVMSKSVAGGCDLDANYPSIPHASCICKSHMGCGGNHACSVSVMFDNIVDPMNGPSFSNMLVVGSNANAAGLPAIESNISRTTLMV